jgi:hypothetical protein
MAEQLTSWLGTLSSTLTSSVDAATNSNETDRCAPIVTTSWPPFELVPGERLGQLALGASAQTITRWLQACNVPLQLDVEYMVPSAESLDLCLSLRRGDPASPFLKLHFGGRRQRLSLIEIVDLGSIDLTCGGLDLVSLPAFSDGVATSTPPLTMRRLCDVLDGQGVFVGHGGFTHWPQGVAAWALSSGTVDTSIERMMIFSPGSSEPEELIVNGRLPRATGADGRSARPSAPPDIVVQLSRSGALFTVVPEDVTLQFGMQVQDVLASIGSPDEEYNGSQGSHHDLLAGSQIYVHNYFCRGFDIVYLASSHAVAGFVMHTNFAADPDFGVYDRCCFSVRVDTVSHDAELASEPETEPSDMIDAPDVCLHPESSRDEALTLLGPPSPLGRDTRTQPPLALATLMGNGKEDPLGEKEVLWWANYGLVLECMAGAEETCRDCRCVTTVTVLPLRK